MNAIVAVAALIMVTLVTPPCAFAQPLTTGDTVSLRAPKGAYPSCRCRTLRSDASRGKTIDCWGAILGGAAGLGLAALIRSLSSEPERPPAPVREDYGECWACRAFESDPRWSRSHSRDDGPAAGTILAATTGLLLGYIVGREFGRWERVELVPTVGTAGALSLSLRFGL
jgi:hypothetical protein